MQLSYRTTPRPTSSMPIDVRPFLEAEAGLSVSILAGANGGGKSSTLDALARHFSRHDLKVVAISNTPYDAIKAYANVVKVSAAAGEKTPLRVFKEAIGHAADSGSLLLASINRTLEYCGYAPEFGIRISRVEVGDVEALRQALMDIPYIGEARAERVISACLFATDVSPEDGIAWLDFQEGDFRASRNEAYATIIQFERFLKRLGVIGTIGIFLRKKDGWGPAIPLHKASSGELTLISTLGFIGVHARDAHAVLIDEPENSLHPMWQKQYLPRLVELFYLYQPKIFVATHSPIVVSGAQMMSGVNLRIYETSDRQSRLLKPESESVEGALWEIFHTITPKNHYLSETLARALDSLSRRRTGLQDVLVLIDDMAKTAYDPEQVQFFRAAAKLAHTIASDGPSDVVERRSRGG